MRRITDIESVPGECLVDGNLVVEADADPFVADERNVSLLRINVSRADANGDVADIDGANYLPHIPCDADEAIRQAALERVAHDVRRALDGTSGISQMGVGFREATVHLNWLEVEDLPAAPRP